MDNMGKLKLFLLALLYFANESSAQSSGTIIPLYVWPAKDPSTNAHTWKPVYDAKKSNPSVPVWAIVNVNSGPGTTVSSEYKSALETLISKGIKALAYVSTDYTKRPAAQVRSDIDTWLKLYPNTVTGIFFDEMSNENDDQKLASTYYKNLNDYAKKQKGINFTVGNPGTDTSVDFVSTVDTIIIYETDTFPTEAKYGTWHKNHPRCKWGILPYNVSPQSYDSNKVKNAKKTVKFIYVTDDNLPNPWDTVASYLPKLLQDLKD